MEVEEYLDAESTDEQNAVQNVVHTDHHTDDHTQAEQVDQRAQQRPASAAVQPGPQTASGRKPLFGN